MELDKNTLFDSLKIMHFHLLLEITILLNYTNTKRKKEKKGIFRKSME